MDDLNEIMQREMSDLEFGTIAFNSAGVAIFGSSHLR